MQNVKKEPRPTASTKSLGENSYGTPQEGQSLGRLGPGGDGPTSSMSSPALKGAPMFQRKKSYKFNSDSESGDAMPKRGK